MKKHGKYGALTRELVVDTIIALGGSATKIEVDSYLKTKIKNYKNNTDANLRSITVNVERSSWPHNKRARRTDDKKNPDNKYDKLFREGNRYTLYNLDTHGVWEIYEKYPDEWKTRQAEPQTEQEIIKNFEIEVASAMQLTSLQRLKKLNNTNPELQVKEVVKKVFIRNPYVVAEVRHRANGKCEYCKSVAPFFRSKDSTPYLEVHHVIPLAEGGLDIVDNAIALCPNCHRQTHYGALKLDIN